MNDRRMRRMILYLSMLALICYSTVRLIPDAQQDEAPTAQPLPADGEAAREPEQLYAQSAVLMDADSGRVLFEKNGEEVRPMASTTKIMTCILTLEQMEEGQEAVVSEYAASQPRVRLGAVEGQRFLVQDLLYSLMLESHNDTAVILAEAIGGSVEGFVGQMNRKARELGCLDTHFVTPNGLDQEDGEGIHATTAVDLARMMKYCIMDSPKKEEFLEVTRTQDYTFQDLDGKQGYACQNHNAFLSMMEGALSGKTGFTGNAGYCYVGSLRRDGRTFIVALLACGWPDHKNYKWQDTKKLMTYACENYEYRTVWKEPELPQVTVVSGVDRTDSFASGAKVPVGVRGGDGFQFLLRKDETVQTRLEVEQELTAPVSKNQAVGVYQYYLDGELIREFPVVALESVKERTWQWCADLVMGWFLL